MWNFPDICESDKWLSIFKNFANLMNVAIERVRNCVQALWKAQSNVVNGRAHCNQSVILARTPRTCLRGEVYIADCIHYLRLNAPLVSHRSERDLSRLEAMVQLVDNEMGSNMY